MPESKQDRELIELLNELRVALPGVQVMFAFLLAVPFSQGWTKITDTQKAPVGTSSGRPSESRFAEGCGHGVVGYLPWVGWWIGGRRTWDPLEGGCS